MTIVVVMLEVDGSKNSPNLQLIKLLTNKRFVPFERGKKKF